MITGVFGGTRRTSRSTKIQTQTTGSNFSVKSGAILPSLSGTFRKDGSMSTSESKLNNTRIDLLKMLRERHEHCVDKFLTQRQKIRALVGFTVVICEDTPLTILNLYLFVWGCDYKEYYAKEFNIAGDAVDENSEKEIDQCSVTENRYKYLFWVVCVMMTVWLVGWKLKDVYELVSLNRRIGHLDILIEAATSEGEEVRRESKRETNEGKRICPMIVYTNITSFAAFANARSSSRISRSSLPRFRKRRSSSRSARVLLC